MAPSRALRRLLRIREMEEEQSRMALESALAGLHRLEHAHAAAAERDRRGRRLVEASARSGELSDRLAGLEETQAARRVAHVLVPRIANAQQEAARRRDAFLAQRVERRQVETLIEEAAAEAARDRDRRNQQSVDDWYRNRRHRQTSLASQAQSHPGGPPRPEIGSGKDT